MTTGSVRAQVRKRQKARQDVTAFAALIADPADTTFTMPASGKIRFVAIAGAVANDLAATLVGAYRGMRDGVPEDGEPEFVLSDDPEPREIKTPLLTAGGYVVIDRIERAVEVTLEAGFAAYVDTGLGVFKKIAENP